MKEIVCHQHARILTLTPDGTNGALNFLRQKVELREVLKGKQQSRWDGERNGWETAVINLE